MIMLFNSPLPCAQLSAVEPSARCDQPTVVAVVIPAGDGLWELFPVCQQHLDGCRWSGTDRDGVDALRHLGQAGRDRPAVCPQRQPRVRRRPALYYLLPSCPQRF